VIWSESLSEGSTWGRKFSKDGLPDYVLCAWRIAFSNGARDDQRITANLFDTALFDACGMGCHLRNRRFAFDRRYVSPNVKTNRSAAFTISISHISGARQMTYDTRQLDPAQGSL
jgi:hypothetical protein